MYADTPHDERHDLAADVTFHRQHLEAHVRYMTILRSAVFTQVTLADAKQNKAFKKKLLEFESYGVLALIWVGSDYAHQRSPLSHIPRPLLTCHSIARRVAFSDSLKAANEAVSVICRAAEAYGLLEKIVVAQNKIDLLGTQLLHSVMAGMRQPFTDVAMKPPPGSIENPSEMLSQE